jgi:hypothetical protein
MQGIIGHIGSKFPVSQKNDAMFSIGKEYAMSEMNAAAFGIFPDRLSIETVVTTLKREGFRNSDVSVLFRENRGTWVQTQHKNSKATVTVKPKSAKVGSPKATSTTVGSSHGALRWLAGLSAIAVPGEGMFVAVGPIRAALEGTAFGGLHGALAGSLIGMGVPENRARRYEGRLSSSWFLLSVHNTDSQQMRKAKQILTETLAEDVLTTDESDADDFDSNRSLADEPVIAGAGMSQGHTSR